jgi:nitroimidazol reductase NimA-like FMN-containing flavoprotein (pyridoxamine 5'-phosphate oxidase superfamily)
MTLSARPAATAFHALTEERCRELLASRHEGRIAWEAPDGPQLLPVSYVLHHGEIAFRTSPYGVLSQLQRPTPVAFEIDDLHPDDGVAWSVLVRGRAEPVTSAVDLAALWGTPELVPWATGTRNLVILVTARSISGRAVTARHAD